MKTLKELQDQLDSPIPRSAVKEREGNGGRKFSYLSTDHVIDRMNRLFGNLNWATETAEIRCVHQGTVESYGKTSHSVHYIARVKIEAQHLDEQGRVVRTSHMGTGYGDGSDKNNPGKAHELAAKEAESDALKRACKNLGQSMGLALYDKDQTNVEDDSAGKLSSAPAQAAKPAQATPSTTGAVSEGRQTNPPATRPAFDRQAVNKAIDANAKVIVAKSAGTVSIANIKADMKAKYNVEDKTKLTDEQAQELLETLKQRASA